MEELNAQAKDHDAGNCVFIVRPSYDVKDLKVSGRIFLQSPDYDAEVVHFIIQGSSMRLSGVPLEQGANNLFAPEDKDAVTTLIARATADYFRRT